MKCTLYTFDSCDQADKPNNLEASGNYFSGWLYYFLTLQFKSERA